MLRTKKFFFLKNSGILIEERETVHENKETSDQLNFTKSEKTKSLKLRNFHLHNSGISWPVSFVRSKIISRESHVPITRRDKYSQDV